MGGGGANDSFPIVVVVNICVLMLMDLSFTVREEHLRAIKFMPDHAAVSNLRV